jgi:hypothetical protein
MILRGRRSSPTRWSSCWPACRGTAGCTAEPRERRAAARAHSAIAARASASVATRVAANLSATRDRLLPRSAG